MTVDDMERYHELTTGSIWLLSLMSAGVKDVNCDVAAKHAARCIGLANALRAQPLMKGFLYLLMMNYCKHSRLNSMYIY